MDYPCLATKVSQICFYLYLKNKAQLNANFCEIQLFTESTEIKQCYVWTFFPLNFNPKKIQQTQPVTIMLNLFCVII